SILIFTNVVSTMPAQFANIKATAGFALFTVVMIMGLAMIVAIVFVEQGQRRIPVQFAKRQVGRRMYGGQSTYIPLKVNSAGVIPGIRPGPPTERYLGQILNRITLPGSLFLAAIAIIPQIVLAVRGVQNFPFGGTTILISVGVALETMKQIDSQLMMRNYEGFLK